MNDVMNYVRDAVKYMALIAVAVIALYLGKSFSCTKIGEAFTAMRPEVAGGQLVLIDRRATRSGSLRLGDLICYGEKAIRAGRVSALAGQTFEVRGGALTVDGARCEAPSLARSDIPPIMVPSGCVLVTFNELVGRSSQVGSHLVPLTAIKGEIIR